LRREIGHRLFLLEEDLAGNVKKLKGSINEYRLRIGEYRVLFELDPRKVTVYAVGNRKDIYR
jgi:mRNA interferase RelE/StbE